MPVENRIRKNGRESSAGGRSLLLLNSKEKRLHTKDTDVMLGRDNFLSLPFMSSSLVHTLCARPMAACSRVSLVKQ